MRRRPGSGRDLGHGLRGSMKRMCLFVPLADEWSILVANSASIIRSLMIGTSRTPLMPCRTSRKEMRQASLNISSAKWPWQLELLTNYDEIALVRFDTCLWWSRKRIDRRF